MNHYNLTSEMLESTQRELTSFISMYVLSISTPLKFPAGDNSIPLGGICHSPAGSCVVPVTSPLNLLQLQLPPPTSESRLRDPHNQHNQHK